MGNGNRYSSPDLEPEWQFYQNGKKGVAISEDILFYIAENILSNVRELEGALNQPSGLSANGKQGTYVGTS